MWTAKAYRRNVFLHNTLDNYKPIQNNEAISDQRFDMALPARCEFEHRPYECDLCTTEVCRAPVGYGSWGVPLLSGQLSSREHRGVREPAITTLRQELYDPVKCYTAVQNNQLLQRLRHILNDELNYRYNLEEDIAHVTVVRTLHALQRAAGHVMAATQITEDPLMMELLYRLIVWPNSCVRREAGQVLVEACSFAAAADPAWQGGFLEKTLDALRDLPEQTELLSLFALLAERNPQRALDAGCFEYYLPLLTDHSNVTNQTHRLRAFCCAIQTADGQLRCDKHLDCLLPYLCQILEENHPTDDEAAEPTVDWRQETGHLEWAAAALTAVLCSRRARWHAQSMSERMTEVLVLHAHCKHNRRLQFHCLQALRHTTEMPAVKRYVRGVCLPRLTEVNCQGSEQVRQSKMALLRWLRHRNYRLEAEEVLHSNVVEPHDEPAA